MSSNENNIAAVLFLFRNGVMHLLPILARLTLMIALIGWSDLLVAQQPTDTLTPDQIRQLVAALGSDSFSERQAATRRLVRGGSAVIGPLQDAIGLGEPETQMRAVTVIGRLAVSADRECQKLAQNILAELSQSEDRIVRQLALQTVSQLGEAMQDRAIDHLRERGADIAVEEYFDGVRQSRGFEIVIGPEFRGTTEDFGMLSWLEGQTKLTLIGEQINDQVIGHVATMPSLYWLTIKRGVITNQSIVSLSPVKPIRYLHLYYVAIDDKCMDAMVDMKGLTQLRLFGTRISREKGEWAQQAMTTTDVDFRNGAFLGIYFNDTDGPCIVNNVVKDSAADRAGFQAGDQVIWFAKKKIKTGQQFLRSVADYFPGDKVKAGVMRNEKEIELELELGRFPDVEEFKE